MFNGTVNPNGLATTVKFQWGTKSSALSSSTTVQTIAAGTKQVAIPKATVTGLASGTKYYFRATGTNSRGTSNGSTLSFTTTALVTPKTVYLTFDDGPSGGSTGYTSDVLTDLEAAGVHASFFETGQPQAADYYPTSGMYYTVNQPLLARQLADGDQIGTHTWSHPEMPTLSCADQQTEISEARNLQVSLTGHDSKLFRYPYFQSTTCADAYLASQGMVAMNADVDPSDWNAASSDAAIISNVMANVHNGSIVDLHDGMDVLYARSAPTYLPTLISDLKAAGYTPAALPPASSPTAQALSEVPASAAARIGEGPLPLVTTVGSTF